MSLAFEWIDLTKGRGKFGGLIRGYDEAGHDTYALDLDGSIGWGEVAARYAGDEQSIEVVSFGYNDRENVGIPNGTAAYSATDAATIESMARELIAVVSARPNGPDRPSTLRTPRSVRLTGEIVIRDGWIRLVDDLARSAT